MYMSALFKSSQATMGKIAFTCSEHDPINTSISFIQAYNKMLFNH